MPMDQTSNKMRKRGHYAYAVERAHTNTLNANDMLVQTRPHVRNAIASRKRQLVMRKGKSTISPYCTTQLGTLLWWLALNGINQECMVRAVAADSQSASVYRVLPVWLFWSRIWNFWLFSPIRFFMSIRKIFGRFLDSISGVWTQLNFFYWKLCTSIYNFLFCCFNFVAFRFTVSGYSSARRKVLRNLLMEWDLFFLYIKYVDIAFLKAHLCFKGVVSYLCCIWHFSKVDLAFFACDYLATLGLPADTFEIDWWIAIDVLSTSGLGISQI